ncbi:YrhB domain-containing protein [Herbaspirillum huttiense]|uniref:YrhB domain-containing protein n=1 Tax=Herbaspirillum huttiense TaxID=863372 RepID=UPI003B3BD583
MISRIQAQALAESHISQIAGSDVSFAILDDQTVERPFGWVFFYQSRRHLETRDPSEVLAGNAPLIVDRLTGKITETGTAHPLEHYLSKYEAERGADSA